MKAITEHVHPTEPRRACISSITLHFLHAMVLLSRNTTDKNDSLSLSYHFNILGQPTMYIQLETVTLFSFRLKMRAGTVHYLPYRVDGRVTKKYI